MIKSRLMKMDELQKATTVAAFAIGASLLMLFICIFRVSNFTTLVIVVNAAIIGIVSVIFYDSKVRYLVLAILLGGLILELVVRQEGSGLYTFSVAARFAVTGFLISFFAPRITRASHMLYINMHRLASERESALEDSRRWLARANSLVMLATTISMRGMKSNLRETFTESLQEARNVFNADSGLIYSVDRETGRLEIMSSFGYGDALLDKMKTRGVSTVESCEACRQRDPVAVDNLASDEKCRSLASVKTGSCICLPIRTRNNLWGVLHLRRQHPDAFSTEDIQLAQAMSYQFAIAMQRAYLFEQLNRLAITDALTGLYNYRKLVEDLQREIVRSKRYTHPFSFIMCDIDHFKDFNDTYGHQAGDEVLREVARTLNGGKREVDRVYRYGGEEFSILLPETDWQEAVEVAEKLRRKVEAASVSVEGNTDPLSVTISFGVASFPADSREVETLIMAADEALYASKAEGRNLVRAHARIHHEAEGTARAYPVQEDIS